MQTRTKVIGISIVALIAFLLALVYFRYEPRPVTPVYVPAPRVSPRPSPIQTPDTIRGNEYPPSVSESAKPATRQTKTGSFESAATEPVAPPALPPPARMGWLPRIYANDVIALPRGVWRVPLGFMLTIQQDLPAGSGDQGHCSKPTEKLSPETYVSMGFSQVGTEWYFLGTPCHIDIETGNTIERLHVSRCLKQEGAHAAPDSPDCAGQRQRDKTGSDH